MKSSHTYVSENSSADIGLINGIKFTPRELDILACTLGGRTAKKIAFSLSLSPRTVENYTRSIMTKIGGNSREYIIDFIEKSDKIPQLRQRYSTLFSQVPFSEEKHLKFLEIRSLSPYTPANSCESAIKLQEKTIVRSDLSIPVDSALLECPEFMTQLVNVLKGKKDIQTVALIGPGGAGKTTFARLYARQSKASVIWEINAETHESIVSSFEKLARALVNTLEEQQALIGIQDTENAVEREEKIIQFVKDHLKTRSSWLLLYDNVEKFSDIPKYFPQDMKTWGVGKAIITSRNANIKNNKHINHCIQVEILNSKQKLELFNKIIQRDHKNTHTDSQFEETKQFLKNIPPHPLDVTVSAYYIKTTNIPYSSYVENLSQNNDDFSILQENILKEAGEYTRTRYGIITLSVEKILNEHRDFTDLLLFVSLVNSQDIPRDLLISYKNHAVVDSFIFHLKKYSFIIDEISVPSVDAVFSIHRSTQAVILNYFIKKLNLENEHNHFQYIIEILESHIYEAGDVLEKIKHLVTHLEALSNHDNLLTNSLKGKLETRLGYMHSYLCNYEKSNYFFERAEDLLKKTFPQDCDILAQNLAGQGRIHIFLGNYEKAEKLLKEGLEVYKNNNNEKSNNFSFLWFCFGTLNMWAGNYKEASKFLEKSLDVSLSNVSKVVTVSRLGNAYMHLGDYKKALDLSEETLDFAKTHLPKNSIRLSCAMVSLGRVYEKIGYYEKAKDLMENSMRIDKEHLPENHIIIVNDSINLVSVHIALGEYEKAKFILEKNLHIYETKNPKNNIKLARCFLYLGNVYYALDSYEKGKKFLEKSLAIYKEYYGNEHIETAQILNNVGHIYLCENQFDKAERMFQNSLKVLEKNKHPQRYSNLENLAELFFKKSEFLQNKKNLKTHSAMKKQSRDYLEQALQIAKETFPEDSPHIERLQSKLKSLV